MRPYFNSVVVPASWAAVESTPILFSGNLIVPSTGPGSGSGSGGAGTGATLTGVQIRGGDHANVTSTLLPGSVEYFEELDLSKVEIQGNGLLLKFHGSVEGMPVRA